jgi:hypothetical protein
VIGVEKCLTNENKGCYTAAKGMRVKLSIQALKARNSKTQGESPGNGMGSNQP